MQINFTIDAFATLSGIVNFVESKNTLGAGVRWLDKFEKHLEESLISPASINLCNNETFYKLQLR